MAAFLIKMSAVIDAYVCPRPLTLQSRNWIDRELLPSRPRLTPHFLQGIIRLVFFVCSHVFQYGGDINI